MHLGNILLILLPKQVGTLSVQLDEAGVSLLALKMTEETPPKLTSSPGNSSRDLFIPKRWRSLNITIETGHGSPSEKGYKELPGL